MAETIVSQCTHYKTAIQRMMALGCDITKLDFTPPAWPAGVTWTDGDFTGGNGTNRAGNGSCALFDIRGGALNWRKLPSEPLATTSAGYTTHYAAHASNMNAISGYPYFSGFRCLTGVGTCPSSNSVASTTTNATLFLHFININSNTCGQINSILKLPAPSDGNLVIIGVYSGNNIKSVGDTVVSGNIMYSASKSTEGCAVDVYSDNNAYLYTCALSIR